MCDSKCSLGTFCSSEGCKARQKTNFVSRKGIVMYLCLPWNCYTRTYIYIYIYLYYVHKSQCIPFISPWSSIVFNRVPKLHRRNRSESQQHIDHTWRAHKGRLTGSWVPSKISPRMIYVVHIWLIYGCGDISIVELPVDEYPLVFFLQKANLKMAQSK